MGRAALTWAGATSCSCLPPTSCPCSSRPSTASGRRPQSRPDVFCCCVVAVFQLGNRKPVCIVANHLARRPGYSQAARGGEKRHDRGEAREPWVKYTHTTT